MHTRDCCILAWRSDSDVLRAAGVADRAAVLRAVALVLVVGNAILELGASRLLGVVDRMLHTNV